MIWRRRTEEALEQEIEEIAGSHQSHQLNVHI